MTENQKRWLNTIEERLNLIDAKLSDCKVSIQLENARLDLAKVMNLVKSIKQEENEDNKNK